MSVYNILIIDELAYPALGGQQVRFKELAETWVNSNYSVTIYSIDHLGNLPSNEVINGVKYVRPIANSNYYKNGKFGRDIKTIFKFTFELRKVKWSNYDYVIFNQFPILPAIIFGNLSSSNTILDFVEHRSGFYWSIIQYFLINSTKSVNIISNTVLGKVLNYRKKNLEVIPSLVKNCYPLIPESKEYFIFFGRQETHKHPDHAIEAIINYNQRYSANETLIMMGDGAMHENMKKKYSTYKNIQFTGRVTDEEKEHYLSHAKALILPSEREGLPKVVIEAMAYGVPTITTRYKDNGTCGYIEEFQVGLVANPTIQDIADKINQMNMDLKTYYNRCIEVVKNHDLNLNSKKYLLYE